MKKLSKKVKFDIGENKIIDVIDNLLEGRLGGDWNDYEEGDEIKYKFNFNDEDELELIEECNVSLDELKEFIGEGICYIVNEDIWYNIKFKDNIMIVKFEYVDLS
jgi:hypothetical protein